MKVSNFFATLIASLALCASLVAAPRQQQTAPPDKHKHVASDKESVAKDSPVAKAVRERANQYYAAVLKGNRAAAAEFVTPATRETLPIVNYESLISAQVKAIEVAPDGKSAVVTMARRQKVPMVDYMDIELKDTWKFADGQWRLELPNPSVAETPFGPMKRSTTNGDPTTTLQERQKNVDPDQVYKAIDKVDRQQREKAAPPQASAPSSTSPAKPPVPPQN